MYMAGLERRNCVVVFMGRQRNASCSSGGLGRNRRWKRGLAYRRTEETALCSTGHVRNGILFIGRGLAYRKTEESYLCSSAYGRNGVLLMGRGVAYRKTEETDLCWSATVELGVPFIGRGVAYRKTGLHGILFISTIDLSSLHGLLFNQPSPRATVQPPLHGLLFI